MDEPITFRLLRRDDMPLLHEWLQRPHVAEWWHPSPTLGEVAGEFEPLTRPGFRDQGYIALIGGRPIGYVQSYVDRLFADPAVTKVQTDPDPANARAIRCYEKAGFIRVAEVDTPDGRALLMVCRRRG
jgi:RimJ/RimL family protein N-acetyltransferase